MDISLLTFLTGIMVTIITSVWAFAMWTNRQFNSLRTLVYATTEKIEKHILEKFEYHERHDDDRFGRIRDDLWELRVRMAAGETIDYQKAVSAKKDPQRTN